MKTKNWIVYWGVPVFTLMGCVPLTTKVTEIRSAAQTSEPSSGSDHVLPTLYVPTTGFVFSAPPSQQLNLGESNRLVTLSLTAANSYSGTVDLKVDSGEISNMDPGKYVSINVSPSQITLSPGNSQQVQVSISTDTLSPSFTSKFRVRATETGGAPNAPYAAVDVPLQVKAIYEVKILGGSVPEQWMVPANLAFRPHSEGVTINFVNYDNASTHVVHGNNAIPHQNPGAPLVKASSGAPQGGGTYSVTVAAGTVKTGSFYCHSHEGSASAHNVTFNKGQDKAIFSAINTNILMNKCVSCHGNNGDGGVSLNTYGNVFTQVNAGSASSSALFIAVSNGSMPPGNPLSTEEKLAIFDWINAGAQSN